MKLKYNIVLSGLVLLLAACSPPKAEQPPKFPPTIVCIHKYDSQLDFEYDPKKATQWHSSNYNVNVYLIDTIDGKQIAINSLELENYTCN